MRFWGMYMCLTLCNVHVLMFSVKMCLLILVAVLTSVGGQERILVHDHCLLSVFLSYRPRIELIFYIVCISESALLFVFMN